MDIESEVMMNPEYIYTKTSSCTEHMTSRNIFLRASFLFKMKLEYCIIQSNKLGELTTWGPGRKILQCIGKVFGAITGFFYGLLGMLHMICMSTVIRVCRWLMEKQAEDLHNTIEKAKAEVKVVKPMVNNI